MKRKGLIFFCLIFVVIIASPYLIKFISIDSNNNFGGFLINPIDGNSYLAKMEQGQNGKWEFQLPFTSDPGEGEFLFVFYLALGCLSSLFGLENILVFHLARILSAIFMVIAINSFLLKVFNDSTVLAKRAVVLVSFGSGLGWFFAGFGHLFSDFWVAEAYPFLASYTNPHFCLGIALLITAFNVFLSERKKLKWLKLGVSGLALASVMPFGYVVMTVILSVYCFIECVLSKRQKLQICFSDLLAVSLLGGLLLIFQYVRIYQHPFLSIWNEQNFTSTAPFWDVFISFSPCFLLAFFALKDFISSENKYRRLTAFWMLVGFLLIFIPFSLQRRFMFALYVPVSVLAVKGLDHLVRKEGILKRTVFPAIFILSIFTNLILISSGLLATPSEFKNMYFTNEEKNLFSWIQENTDADSLFLCTPDVGLLVPAHTGRRVVYGHPFETVYAEKEKEFVESCFERGCPIEEISKRGVDYVVIGFNDNELANKQISEMCSEIVYENSEIKVCNARSQ